MAEGRNFVSLFFDFLDFVISARASRAPGGQFPPEAVRNYRRERDRNYQRPYVTTGALGFKKVRLYAPLPHGMHSWMHSWLHHPWNALLDALLAPSPPLF